MKRANCEREQVYADLVSECEERCCVDGQCRYSDSHTTNAGKLLPRYEASATTYTEDGPCSPSTPSAAMGMFGRPVATFIAVTITTAVSLFAA